MKNGLAVLICLLWGFGVGAQQTAIYYDPNRAYQTGLDLFDHEDFVNAREAFTDLLEQTTTATDPEIKAIRVNAEYYRALSALQIQNPDAEQLMAGFLENHTDNVKSNMAHFHLGHYYYTKRRYRDAIGQYEQVRTYELDYEQTTDYKFELAYSYFFNKDFTKAKKYFNDVKSSPEYHHPAHYYHGFISFTQGDYDNALSDFKKVEEDAYFGRVVPFYITSILFQQKKYQDVVDYAVPLLDQRNLKYYAEINQLVGKAYFEMEQYEKALPLLLYYEESTRRIAKEDIFQLAYTQHKLGEYEDAIDNFEQLSREKDSLGQHALYLLGDSYLKTGDLRKARTALYESASMDQDRTVQENAMYNYAKVSFELGIHNQAISATKEFLKEFPNSLHQQEARELLTQMFLTTRNYREAIETIESMDNKTPKIKEAYQKVTFYRGVELFNDGKYGPASEYFQKSLEYPIDASIHAQSYFWLAEVQNIQGNSSQSIANYSKFLNLADVAKDLPIESSKATGNYGIAYGYFSKEDYSLAKNYFSAAVRELGRLPNSNEGRLLKNRINPDATLRLADCHFMLEEYDQALGRYQEIANAKGPGADYASFQEGMLRGVKGDISGKINVLQRTVRDYPRSYFHDDALFQLASAYLLQKNHSEATRYFEQVVRDEPGSPYRVQSLLKLGLIHYNTRQDQKALEYYKAVAENYPGTPEANEALSQIKRISIEMGDPSIYIGIAGADISEQDSLLYKTAENAYHDEEYGKARQRFTEYLKQFPDGYFAMLAHYYRGDCYYREKEYIQALPDYEYVINAPNNQNYLQVSYLRAAKVHHFILKNPDQAYLYYEPLYNIATMKATQFEALRALMDLAFETERYNKARQFSEAMLQHEQAEPGDKISANYYIAKVAYRQSNMQDAMTYFTKVKELTDNEKGVEARYHIAKIHFERNDLKLAEAECDNIVKNHPGYEYWLVKTLVLISDIYVQQEEYFQAKSTLESIVNGYSGDPELLNEAKQKLEAVQILMDEKSKVKGPEDDPFNPENDNE